MEITTSTLLPAARLYFSRAPLVQLSIDFMKVVGTILALFKRSFTCNYYRSREGKRIFQGVLFLHKTKY